MSTITLKDVTTFVKLVDLLKDLKEECTLIFTKTSIEVSTIDDAQVNFIRVSLEDVYSECKLKKEVSIYVNLKNLLKILKCIDKDEICQIKFNIEYIQLIFINQKNEGYSKYKLRLLHREEEEEMEDPEIEENLTMVMTSSYLSSLCKKISKFDESLLIECIEEENEVLVKSGTDDLVEFKLVEEQGKLNKLSIEEDLRIMVLMKFMLVFVKAEKFSEQVIINIQDENSPLEIIYNFGNSFIRFYTSSQDIEE